MLSQRQELLAALNKDGREKWWIDPRLNRVLAKYRGDTSLVIRYVEDHQGKHWCVRTQSVEWVTTAAEAVQCVGNYLKSVQEK